MSVGYFTCRCCGDRSTMFQNKLPEDMLCYSCRVRDSLCLHNMNQHWPYRHSSRPHMPGEPCPDGYHILRDEEGQTTGYEVVSPLCVLPEEGVNPWRVAPPPGPQAKTPPSDS